MSNYNNLSFSIVLLNKNFDNLFMRWVELPLNGTITTLHGKNFTRLSQQDQKLAEPALINFLLDMGRVFLLEKLHALFSQVLEVLNITSD